MEDGGLNIDASLEHAERLLASAKHPDTESHFAATCDAISRVVTPELCAPYRRAHKPRVAFYLPSTAILAHTVNLITLTRGLEKIGDPLDYVVIARGTPSGEMNRAFPRVLFADGHGQEHWTDIAARLRRLNFDALVHVSNISGAHFAAQIRCAKKHVLWAQKWTGDIPGLDAIIDGRNPTLDGMSKVNSPPRGIPTWNTYTALPELHRADVLDDARDLRQALKAQTVYGVFARDEKYSADFIACCRRIAQTEGTRLVYASRAPVPEMPGDHIGWLNSDQLSTWINAVDIILDPFPFPGGHVTFEAMASRKPIVFMRVPKGGQVFAAEMMERKDHAPMVAITPDEYVNDAIRLADTKFARELSNGYRDFYDKHLRDERRMAREFTEAIGEIVG